MKAPEIIKGGWNPFWTISTAEAELNMLEVGTHRTKQLGILQGKQKIGRFGSQQKDRTDLLPATMFS